MIEDSIISPLDYLMSLPLFDKEASDSLKVPLLRMRSCIITLIYRKLLKTWHHHDQSVFLGWIEKTYYDVKVNGLGFV